MLLSYLGIFGDKKRQNLNIFLKVGAVRAVQVVGFLAAFVVSTGGRCSGSWRYFADVSKIGQYITRCSAFYSLCRSSLGALALNMALFRVFRAFLGGFMGFVWVCVGLVVCVACGAFVRVSG